MAGECGSSRYGSGYGFGGLLKEPGSKFVKPSALFVRHPFAGPLPTLRQPCVLFLFADDLDGVAVDQLGRDERLPVALLLVGRLVSLIRGSSVRRHRHHRRGHHLGGAIAGLLLGRQILEPAYLVAVHPPGNRIERGGVEGRPAGAVGPEQSVDLKPRELLLERQVTVV